MSGARYVKFASLVYPDLSPIRGWGFEYDPRPAAAPGYVLIKRSAHSTLGGVAHEWYYLDPRKGYAVVRAELFNLAAGVPADPKVATTRQTIRLDDFQRSPQGFWYPSVIYDTMSRMPAVNRKVGPGVQDQTWTVHYHFDFGAASPDSLFVVAEASNSRK